MLAALEVEIMSSCESSDWGVGATLRSSVKAGCSLRYRVIIPNLAFVLNSDFRNFNHEISVGQF